MFSLDDSEATLLPLMPGRPEAMFRKRVKYSWKLWPKHLAEASSDQRFQWSWNCACKDIDKPDVMSFNVLLKACAKKGQQSHVVAPFFCFRVRFDWCFRVLQLCKLLEATLLRPLPFWKTWFTEKCCRIFSPITLCWALEAECLLGSPWFTTTCNY